MEVGRRQGLVRMMPDLEVTPTDFVKPDHTVHTDSTVERVKERLGGRAKLGPNRVKQDPPKLPREKEPPSKPGEFVEPIESFYTLVGAGLFPFDPHCATVLLEEDRTAQVIDGHEVRGKNYGKTRARICAETLDEAAQKSENLRRVLRLLTTGGVWGAVIAAHAPIVLAVMSHHTPMMKTSPLSSLFNPYTPDGGNPPDSRA